MLIRFLPSARRVVEEAYGQAVRLNKSELRAEHLLLGLASTDSGIASRALAAQALTTEMIERGIASTVVLESRQGPVTRSDAEALRTVGIDIGGIEHELENKASGSLPSQSDRYRLGGHLPASPDAKRALARSRAQAKLHRQDYIGPEHILLGILDDRSPAVEVLISQGVRVEDLRSEIIRDMEAVS